MCAWLCSRKVRLEVLQFLCPKKQHMRKILFNKVLAVRIQLRLLKAASALPFNATWSSLINLFWNTISILYFSKGPLWSTCPSSSFSAFKAEHLCTNFSPIELVGENAIASSSSLCLLMTLHWSSISFFKLVNKASMAGSTKAVLCWDISFWGHIIQFRLLNKCIPNNC